MAKSTQCWKTAQVLPSQKGGDTGDLNNYQSVSKLSCLSKILESLVSSQVRVFLQEDNVHQSQQSGFRSAHSTITVATSVVDDIVNSLDNKQHCTALVVDLSKALDTVDHNILLNKMLSVGFDVSA